VDESLLIGDGPLVMIFCRFFGLGGELHPSRLAASNFMTAVEQPAIFPRPPSV
jgi:hypothetical protein